MEYKTYLPEVLEEVRDFQGLGAGFDPETEEFRGLAESLAEETWAPAATEWGISAMERLYCLHPLPGENLEQRRFRVMGRIQSRPPYSMGWLRERLAESCGPDGFSAEDDGINCCLTVCAGAGSLENYGILRKTLRQQIPANVELRMQLLYKMEGQADWGVWMQTLDRLNWEES